jgi:YD repeat-containing protein
VKRSTSYAYDDDNRVTAVTNGSSSRNYTYDGFGRVSQKATKHGSATVLTDAYTFRAPSSDATTGQIATHTITAGGQTTSYSYTYYNVGHIKTISDGTYTTSYTYDNADQLTRENNQKAGKTWVWTYDNAGNILSRKEYAYTTGTLGAVLDTVTYAYTDSAWGDLLTSYDGQTITADEIGNMLTDGTWTYTWEHGRELASMTDGSTTWNYTYDADGMRTKRTNGSMTYAYVYNGGQLSQMTVGSNTLYFA